MRVNDPSDSVDGIAILADESALWKIGGLRQIERLALAINQSAANAEPLDVFVVAKPGSESPKWPLDQSRLRNLRISSGLPDHGQFRVISSRLFVTRGGLPEFLSVAPVVGADELRLDATTWNALNEKFERSARANIPDGNGRILADRREISVAERQLLGELAKPQDGWVARFLNRPISRAVTRFLLPLPITPTAWTILIFLLPLTAAFAVAHGNYTNIVIGTLLYHLHSVLDGCDGEIARAKYLESAEGARIDDFCDFAGAIIFLVALGVGLGRSMIGARHFWIFPTEGMLCAVLVALNEILLRTRKERSGIAPKALNESLYPRHRGMIQESGLMLLGDRAVWWLIQLTKRDVGIFLFVLLAIIGLPQWILHSWLAVSIVAVSLTTSARVRDYFAAPAFS
jgi:hypothetical protein